MKIKIEKIIGKLTLPKKNKPIVILCHGFLSRARHLFPFGHALCRQGYGVFSFDFSGHGKSKIEPEKIKVTDHYKELIKVVKYLKKKYDLKKIILLGYSMGGLISLMYASRHKADRLILINPVIDFVDCMKKLTKSDLTRWKQRGFELFKPVYNLKSKKVHKDYLESGTGLRIATENINCPVLILQGDKDKIASSENSKRFFNKLKDEKRYINLDCGHIILNVRIISKIDKEILKYLEEGS